MVTSKIGIDLIKKYEGCRLNAYLDSVKILTIGWGSIRYSKTGLPVKMGDSITQAEADLELIEDIKVFENAINAVVKQPITQNQFDACVSLWFNCGGSNTIVKMINSKVPNPQIHSWWISHYVTAGGKLLKGLVRRRLEEANLFIK